MKIVHHSIYRKIRNERPEIPAQVIIKAVAGARTAYKTLRSNKVSIDKPCLKSNLSIRLDKNLYKWNDKKIQLSTAQPYKRIEVELQLYKKVKDLFNLYKICDPLLFFKNSRLFIQVAFKTESPENLSPDKDCIGIDMGIRNILTVSDGRVYKSTKLLAKKRNIRFLRKKLSKVKTKSARKHLSKLARKEKRFCTNLCHILANDFLKNTNSKTLVFEDLKNLRISIANKNKNKGNFSRFINNRVSSVPTSSIKEIITYKAKRLGFSVILVNPAYTSQIDFRTGKRSGKRYRGAYYANDKKVLHSDFNASCNIAAKAKIPHFLNQHKLNKIIMGQGTVNCPIVL